MNKNKYQEMQMLSERILEFGLASGWSQSDVSVKLAILAHEAAKENLNRIARIEELDTLQNEDPQLDRE